jgi:MFS family permease
MERDLRTQLIWALYLPSVLVATAIAILIPVLPVFAGNLTTAYVLVGLLLAGQPLGQILFDLPAGMMLRRFGLRKTMLGGLAVQMVALLLLTQAGHIVVATALLIAVGVGRAIYNLARHTYLSAAVPARVRGRAIATFGGVFRTGKFLGPVLGGWVASAYDLSAAFAVGALLMLAAGVLVWRYMDDANVPTILNPHHAPPIAQVIQQHNQTFATAGVGQVLGQLTRQGWQWAIPLYGADVLGLDVQVIGIVVGVGGALDMLLFYSAGVIMDRFGRKWSIVPSFILQGFGIALIPLTGGAVGLAVVAALIGAANALSSGSMMTLGGDFAPAEAPGEFLGVWRLIGDTGFMGAPMIIGGLAQLFTLPMAVLTIAGFGLGAGVWFALLVPETLRRVPPAPATGD